ncbi:MAG: hypothetical protein ACRES9_04735, partial [Gammaproteobacteria bacterium]
MSCANAALVPALARRLWTIFIVREIAHAFSQAGVENRYASARSIEFPGHARASSRIFATTHS